MKSSERKHLRMLLFLQNKDSRLKDRNKNKFHFISVAVKTIEKHNFFTAKQTFISALI